LLAPFSVLLQELLGLVDLGGQVWAAAPVRVVQQHERAVVLADLVLAQTSLAVDAISVSDAMSSTSPSRPPSPLVSIFTATGPIWARYRQSVDEVV